MTRITCEENQWRTTCECSLQVSEGLLDAIELDVPASWKESVKTSPAMAGTFAAGSERARQPRAFAVGGDFRRLHVHAYGPAGCRQRDLPSPTSR